MPVHVDVSASDAPEQPCPLLSRYKGNGLLYAFVYRTAQRRVLAALKHRDRSGVPLDDQTPETVRQTPSSIEMDEVKATISKVLSTLSERERIVLRMTCAKSTNSEIAAVITPSGKPRLHDGRVSHIRDEIAEKFRQSFRDLPEGVPQGATWISDLLAEAAPPEGRL